MSRRKYRRKKTPKQPSLPKNPYNTHEWRNLRREVLRRDGGICQYCGASAATADHVIARKLGGPDSTVNLVAVCRSCNALAASRRFDSVEEKREYLRSTKKIPPTFSERVRDARRKRELSQAA